MIAFDVSINDHHFCRAGIDGEASLSACVRWTSDAAGRVAVELRGYDFAASTSLTWPVPDLGVGSRLTVRVIEADSADDAVRRPPPANPQSRRPEDVRAELREEASLLPAEERRQLLAYLRSLISPGGAA